MPSGTQTCALPICMERENPMAQFTISLDPAAAALYLRVAQAAGKPVEEVLADALFKLAGELSLEALQARS